MKSLVLVRHAKSDWSVNTSDKNRAITMSGKLAIQNVASIYEDNIEKEVHIWCSTAKRATETALIFCKTKAIDINRIEFSESLYTFNASELENSIKKCPNHINKLILFGHNEAITNFVNKFGDNYIFNVPTAGLVFLQFETDNWEKINKGRITKKIFPKEI
jgi:phosphohistidine phosphatase